MPKTMMLSTVLLASLAALAAAVAVPGVWGGGVLACAGAAGLGWAATWLMPREANTAAAQESNGTLMFSHIVGSWSVSGYSTRDDAGRRVVVAIAELTDAEDGAALAT